VQPLLQWKSNMYYILWDCVCSLKYIRCNTHAPYFCLWPAQLYNIFPHCLINGTNSNKQNRHWTWKVCFDFSPSLLPEIFLILKRTERDMINSVYWSSRKATFILVKFKWNLNLRSVFFWVIKQRVGNSLDIFSKNTQILNFS